MNKDKLHLILKSEWFDKINKGVKTSEYREITDYWTNVLLRKQYKTVVFHKGYTKNTIEFMIDKIAVTKQPNDLNLQQAYEIKLGQRII